MVHFLQKLADRAAVRGDVIDTAPDPSLQERLHAC